MTTGLTPSAEKECDVEIVNNLSTSVSRLILATHSQHQQLAKFSTSLHAIKMSFLQLSSMSLFFLSLFKIWHALTYIFLELLQRPKLAARWSSKHRLLLLQFIDGTQAVKKKQSYSLKIEKTVIGSDYSD